MNRFTAEHAENAEKYQNRHQKLGLKTENLFNSI